MSLFSRSFSGLLTGRVNSVASPLMGLAGTGYNGFALGLMNLQRRWKSRGNTYQPSTLKRKRRIGFLSRCRSRQENKILQRRKAKGRWYLSH